jgi:hypothetical protein
MRSAGTVPTSGLYESGLRSLRILALGLLISCSSSLPDARPNTPGANASLAAQLGFPAWHSGQPCPRSAWEDLGTTGAPADLGGAGYYTVLGSGPAFPIVYNFDPTRGTLSFGAFVRPRSDRLGGRVWNKIRWIAAPGAGPAVVRGARLDGGDPVSFDTQPGDQLVLGTNAASNAWSDHGAAFSVSGPGCYGFRVEGPDGTVVLVLEVVP